MIYLLLCRIQNICFIFIVQCLVFFALLITKGIFSLNSLFILYLTVFVTKKDQVIQDSGDN